MTTMIADSTDVTGWGDSEARLHAALAQDELCLLVQPILSLSEHGGFPMAEVLVRLREEEKLLLPPGEFLPVFEHFGMLPMLDRWVVSHAAALLAGGRAACPYQRLTVNISGQSLTDAAFPQFIADTLEGAGIAGDRMGLELDEEYMYRFPEESMRFCRAVRHAGTPILIDGFGHHSVTFLAATRLGADILKIDGRVIRKLGSSSLAQQKMRVIMALARKYDMPIIAESVEDLGILPALRQLGVGFAQGFGIARPGPLREVRDNDKSRGASAPCTTVHGTATDPVPAA